MATLELEFNCMCLFVNDPRNGTVHVLMPAASSHHGGHQRHVVRLLHRGFVAPKGRSMEGWALKLRDGSAPVGVADPSGGLASASNIVNLSDITGQGVPERLVADWPLPGEVAARVTLRGGKMLAPVDEGTDWVIDGDTLKLAHQVVWRMENVSEALEWVDLGGNHGPPIGSLSQLESDGDGTYRLSLHHVTEDALPPTGDGELSEAEVRAHFAAFYRLLRVNPRPHQLPKLADKKARGTTETADDESDRNKTYNCKLAQARF